MTDRARTLRALALSGLAVALVALYYRPFIDLVGIWLRNEDLSHGIILAPIIGYLVWARRKQLASTERRPSNLGLLVVIGSLAMLLVGTAGVEFFLMRVSAIGTTIGIVLYLAGWRWLRLVIFPIALTGLLIPIPPVILYQLTFPLQVLATKFGVASLELVRIPALREGNIIFLAHTTLEVTEACSGIRSLLSLFTLGLLYGYFAESRQGPRVIIALSSVPIAIFANGLRVAGTGIAAHYFGAPAATGFFHTFSGWTVFMTSFVMLMLVAHAVKAIRLPAPFLQPQPQPEPTL